MSRKWKPMPDQVERFFDAGRQKDSRQAMREEVLSFAREVRRQRDEELRERLEAKILELRNEASGLVTANDGKPHEGLPAGETHESMARWGAADALERAALAIFEEAEGG
jgi:hypothetical protein